MDKVVVVVLAAGAGRRFAGVKQAALVAGETLTTRAVRAAAESGADLVMLVVGAHREETIEALPTEDVIGGVLVRVVENRAWESGQASSVAAALGEIEMGEIEMGVDGVIFMPVDQPFLKSTLLREMIALWRGGARLVAPSVEGELRGAPALFGREYFDELRGLSGDMGGRVVLRRHEEKVTRVVVGEDELTDIDTRTDLAEAQGRSDRSEFA